MTGTDLSPEQHEQLTRIFEMRQARRRREAAEGKNTMPGPKAGSDGARKIAEAHRGGHDHDKNGGFAANPALAREAGRRGGETVKNRYGSGHYAAIGKKGGDTVARERGAEFFAEIGRKGGTNKGKNRN